MYNNPNEICESMRRRASLGFEHVSVLLNETIEKLNICSDGIYVDGTLGGGGHSGEIAKRLGPNGRLIGIDQDEAAIQAATEHLAPFANKVTIVRNNYRQMNQVLDSLHIEKVNGILLDLGVSSYQLDTADRGFTYRVDAPLDMRMDQRNPMTAKDIINDYSQEELLRVLWDYGEEKYARQIVAKIIKAREDHIIETTGELVELIRQAIPAKILKKSQGHPAKRTFQAIRIELNQELEVLKSSINMMIDYLAPGGRICIITFHSLEDRIVKNMFKKNENPCTCPPSFPVCVCNKVSKGHVITRKPILPSDEELAYNKRSKSAKLRVFEHV